MLAKRGCDRSPRAPAWDTELGLRPSGFGAMRGAWSVALLTVLATTAYLGSCEHVDESERRRLVEALKVRILADLGMKRVPDVRTANASADRVRSMTRRYWQEVAKSEGNSDRIIYYRPTCYHESGNLTFQPNLTAETDVRWARLRFPCAMSSTVDVTAEVRTWLMGDERTRLHLALPIRGPTPCRRVRLEVRLPAERQRRAACGIGECCRRPMRVSFKEIGWDWIVQPQEFDAYFCKGRCRNVTDNFVNTHALIQSILKFQGKKVSSPCCTTKKMKALNLLHYNDKDPPELVVTKQKNMIVKECACG